MGTPVEPQPAKYYIAFIITDLALLSDIEAKVLAAPGEIDARATNSKWLESKYYAAEMGEHLGRGFWSLQALRSAEDLAAVKLGIQAIEIEFRDRGSGGQRMNLDPGYLDTLKVVLASTKNASQRIYLKSGICAEARWFITMARFTDCHTPSRMI